MELFRVRLNCVDHYQAVASEFDPQLNLIYGSTSEKNAPKVPVIRVFGATETGQKVCAHIHGAFPYLYIEYDGSLAQQDVDAYIHRLRLSIDHAMAVTYRRNIYEGKTSFVAHITLVKGVPFYGYHVGYRFFLKIYIYNPLHMTRLADLLRQGTIMKHVFQPYESHLQYLLQWMCDYNLYGCGYIDCDRLKFRGPVPSFDSMDSTMHLWHDRSIPESSVSDESRFPKQSHCSIEVDICVQDILNRHAIKPRPIHHNFMERYNPTSPDEKLVYSMAGLWRDETRRRKAKLADPDSGSSPFPPEVMVSMSAEPRSSQKGGWVHEREYTDRIEVLIRQEKARENAEPISFESLLDEAPHADNVKTAVESVADLFPETLRAANSALPPNFDNQIPYPDEVEVDESKIHIFEEVDLPFNEDEILPEMHHPEERKENDPVQRNTDDTTVNGQYHDERRPNGMEGNAESRVLLDLPTSIRSIKSEDLPQNGVRVVENNIQDPEDDFEVPEAFASDLTATRATAKRSLSEDENIGAMQKKLKLIRDGRTDGQSHHATEKTRDHFGNNVDSAPSDSLSPRQSHHDSELDQSRSTLPSSPHLIGQNLSQQSLKANAATPTRTRAFTVVKNPNSPETIFRLSQKTPSSSNDADGKSRSIKASTGEKSKGIPPTDPCGHDTVPGKWPKLAARLHETFGISQHTSLFFLATSPPQSSYVSATLPSLGLPSVIYQEPYYSDERDVPERAREYAGKEFKLESNSVPYLPDFDATGNSAAAYGIRQTTARDKVKDDHSSRKRKRNCQLRHWEIGEDPPTRALVERWLEQTTNEQHDQHIEYHPRPDKQAQSGMQGRSHLSQIDGPTQRNKHGFKFSQKRKNTSVQHEVQYMSTISLEVHVNTQGNLMPNPEKNEIASIFWCIQSDDEALESNGGTEGTYVGVLALSEDDGLARKISRQASVHVEVENTELDLINRMIDIVRIFDPDILTGYEVHGSSWGYLIERARYKYDFNLCDEFSRMKSQSHGRFGKEADRWGFTHTSTIRVTGRHMINIWRAMRSELNLLHYTMENVVFHLLHRRIPHYTHADLTQWYNSDKPRDLAKVIDYYLSRVQIDLEILEHNELIPRTSEQARLLGVDFFSVFSRGSQFKVESLMFRIAKPENFLLVSPSRKQVGQQNALECLPLVMEPQSAFYTSPVLVLDFQSLYPSIMIAYNYCYSTCLGRVSDWRGQNKMGFTDYKRTPRLLELLKDHLNIAPNGMMYVKPEIRKSLLAKMLSEILETRIMVKSGMKEDRHDRILQQLLNNRQLALKLIANVTYGYTSASFSGRMPCSEIADSIVQTGRETLEKAIALIHSVSRWGAEVVYGDTDSLFVCLKGRTKHEAFAIGNEIAKAVTNINPRPVKLKFEKVYLPCVLLAKKRYVGFKYESKSQTEPEFDAKGIETVRRDSTPAEQKIEEKALKILFRTADLSQVKRYFQAQCRKIMQGKVSVQDFCFAKEVKLGTYSDRGPPPPGALISTKKMLEDPRAEPQYGERVPYVVITGAPGARLIDRCVPPETLLQSESHELDAEYYISKSIIPPLERIFNLVGANVRQWYDEMPKYQRIRRVEGQSLYLGGDDAYVKKTLESYMKSSSCLVCRRRLEGAELPICERCAAQPDTSYLAMRGRLSKMERKAIELEKVCRSCAGLAWGDDVRCDSKDCPVFYSRTRQHTRLRSIRAQTEPMLEGLGQMGENIYTE